MTKNQRLAGQTLLVIGGSTGIGYETARAGRDAGAKVIITARDPDRLQRAGLELDGSIAAFDATDFERLGRFLSALRTPIDHVLVTGFGHHGASSMDFDVEEARRDLETRLLLPLQVADRAAVLLRPSGTLLFMGCTDGRHATGRLAFTSAVTAALSAMTESLAAELAPIRVNLIAAGSVHTSGVGASLDHRPSTRREPLETTVPTRGTVSPGDIAALAVHLMTNTAITGETFEIDGGEQLVE